MRRRRLLKLVGVMGASGLAGCSGGSGGSNSTTGNSGGGTTSSAGETSTTTANTETTTEPTPTSAMNGSSMNRSSKNGSGMNGTEMSGNEMNGSGMNGNGMNGSSMGGEMNKSGMNGSEMGGGGGMNGSGMNGSGMGGGDRNPKAGQVAYNSSELRIEFSSPTKATMKFELPEPTQCSVAYGESTDYGTLRADQTMIGPKKDHEVKITTSAGTKYNAKLDLFDNALNALQSSKFTFSAPESGSATRSIPQRVEYIETSKAEKHFSQRPKLDIGKTNVSVNYRTKTPMIGVVQFQQGKNTTTRRNASHKPGTKHEATINNLQSGTQTQWAVGLMAPDGSMYTTVGMALDTKQ